MSTIDKPTVNLFVDRLCDIFLSSVKQTFLTVKSKQTKIFKKKLGKPVKEWFDNKCKVERQIYRKLKRKYRIEKSITNRENMKISEKI